MTPMRKRLQSKTHSLNALWFAKPHDTRRAVIAALGDYPHASFRWWRTARPAFAACSALFRGMGVIEPQLKAKFNKRFNRGCFF